MFNCVRREDIDYSPYEEGEWRSGFSPNITTTALYVDVDMTFFVCIS